MKKRKALLLWAGIISFVCAAIFIYSLVAITYNINGILEIVSELVDAMYPELTENYLSLIKTYLIVAIIADIIFGVIYIIYSRYSTQRFEKSKTSLTVFTLINILIGMNLVSFVLVLIAQFVSEPLPLPENTLQPSEAEIKTDAFFNVTEQISVLKKKLENNEITEEEYKEILHKLISSTVEKE